MRLLLAALGVVALASAALIGQPAIQVPATPGVPVAITPGAANRVLAVDGSASQAAITFASQPTLGFFRNAPNELTLTVNGNPQFDWSGQFTIAADGALRFSNTAGNATATADLQFTRVAAGEYGITAVLFASLGTPANGTFCYCSDCTIANPCASAGTGAFAKRLNGVWVCN